MIWDTPIHANRSIKAWLSDKETGFSPQFVEVATSQVGRKLTPSPAEIARRGKIITYAGFDEIVKVGAMISACASTCDYAFWVDSRGLSSRFKSREYCDWLECSWKDAYVIADIIVISDVPHRNDTDPAARSDRREIEMLVDARQKKGNCFTLIVGPTLDLDAIEKYKALNKALNGANNGN